MLKPWHKIAIVFVVIFLLSFTLPIYRDICTKDYYSNHKDCATYHISLVWLWQVGEMLNYYGVVITGFLLAWVTYRLVVLGQEQSKTTHAQLRAYVGVSYSEIRIETSSLAAVGSKLVAFVDYQNAGKTPAHEVHLRMSARLFLSGITPPWEDPATADDEGKGGVILPSVKWRRHRDVDGLSGNFDQIIRSLANDGKRIWVWGTISYVDVFGETCCIRFRFWSSTVKRTRKSGKQYFALIPDIAHTKATYGKKQK